MDKKSDILDILNEALIELESKKGSITAGMQKLARASLLLNEVKIHAWCQVQLGNTEYTDAMSNLYEDFKIAQDENGNINLEDASLKSSLSECSKLNIPMKDIRESYYYKTQENFGGVNSVDFIEQKYNLLLSEKRGNDNTYYRDNLHTHLVYIKKYCHDYIAYLINKNKYAGTIKSSFDLLKEAVDDKFLEIDPELAEQMMLAFKSISSDNKEEWSQALTTCRRLLESLADSLYPAHDETIEKRTFKQNQYVNRLWQFMHEAIQSDTNKTLAKAHVDYLGSWLERNNKATNKGVHDEVTQLEATKFVFHIYLMLADLLEYLDDSVVSNTKPHIKKVTIDELEALLNINRSIAKNIIKARVKNGGLTSKQLGEVSGIGKKTLEKAKELIEF